MTKKGTYTSTSEEWGLDRIEVLYTVALVFGLETALSALLDKFVNSPHISLSATIFWSVSAFVVAISHSHPNVLVSW